MALLAGAAYTWARSKAVIKTERSEHLCDMMHPASFGATRRGSASKGKGIATAYTVEKEIEGPSTNVATRRLGAPPQREFGAQKSNLSNKHGAVGGRCVHVGKIKSRDQNRAERSRDQAKRRAERASQANQAACSARAFFLCTKRILKKI